MSLIYFTDTEFSMPIDEPAYSGREVMFYAEKPTAGRDDEFEYAYELVFPSSRESGADPYVIESGSGEESGAWDDEDVLATFASNNYPILDPTIERLYDMDFDLTMFAAHSTDATSAPFRQAFVDYMEGEGLEVDEADLEEYERVAKGIGYAFNYSDGD